MLLIQLKNLELAFGAKPLLDNINLEINSNDKLCIIGRNGEGKSTLLKILSGEIQADSGERQLDNSLKISVLAQELPNDRQGTVFAQVAKGLGELGEILSAYDAEISKGEQTDLKRLETLQGQIETQDGWRFQQRIEAIMHKLNLPAQHAFAALSGGWQRRVMLAQALVQDPDVLILDEPTNHMDLDNVLWLEEQLKQFQGALVFISHDRSFVQNIANRIIELDRGQLYSYPGSYQQFLDYQQKRLEDEALERALFDKKLAQEEAWIRQGIKARRTRNQGRVENLKQLRRERADRRERQGTSKLNLSHSERSGKIIYEIDNLSFAYQDKPIIHGFSSQVMRGDKIGLIGNNGSGKSTLLKLILGQLKPTSGSIKTGTRIEHLYFDQRRDSLDLEKSIAEEVGDGKDYVQLGDKQRHIFGYLQDFLFSPAKAQTPIKALSGGERNRVLLAKLFTRSFNLLIMDEPTNDLDVETLELLEERLSEYQGTLILVSHDRAFLDNLVTQLWVLEDGKIEEHLGGYSDWLNKRKLQTTADNNKTASSNNKTASQAPNNRKTSNNKLTYKERLELAELPEKIQQTEQQLSQLQQQTQSANFYQQPQAQVQALLAQLTQTQNELDKLEERWLELEEKHT